jgi:hypothetical protein
MKPAKKKASAKSDGGAEESVDRAVLLAQINEAFAENERFSDHMVIIKAIQQHGDGKTRVKDLTDEQLESLLDDIRE